MPMQAARRKLPPTPARGISRQRARQGQASMWKGVGLRQGECPPMPAACITGAAWPPDIPPQGQP
eukprot:1618528-Alexandrium_andersonii.AAC.1